MAFRKKIQLILEYNADIIIIQESENLDKIKEEDLINYPNRIWHGDNKNKGILIISKENYDIEILDIHNPEFRYILPITVNNEKTRFNLFAIWAQNNIPEPSKQYIAQVWLALQEYKNLLNENCILIGDFNSNTIWDNDYPKIANHTDVVNFLNDYNIKSIYHLKNDETHGSETIKTLAFTKNTDKLYHIDYCFASRSFYENSNMKIESFDNWLDKSDHVPMIIDFNIDN